MDKHYPGTPKAWAVERGYCKAGRGRPSKEAMDAIAKARAEGWTFGPTVNRDAAPTGPVVSKGKPEKADKPTDNAEGVNIYAGVFRRYDDDQEFYYEHDGKRFPITGRTACMGCGYSLFGHTCTSMVGLTYHGQKAIKPKGE